MAARLDWRPNLGRWDRILRMTLGVFLVLLALYYPFQSLWVPLLAGLFGLTQIAEGLLGY